MPPNEGESDSADRSTRVEELETGGGAVLIDDPVVRDGDSEDVMDELERVHLPVLEAEGVIEWDRESGEIRKGPRFGEVEAVLRRIT